MCGQQFNITSDFRTLTLSIKILLKLPKSHKQVYTYKLSGNMVGNFPQFWPI